MRTTPVRAQQKSRYVTHCEEFCDRVRCGRTGKIVMSIGIRRDRYDTDLFYRTVPEFHKEISTTFMQHLLCSGLCVCKLLPHVNIMIL